MMVSSILSKAKRILLCLAVFSTLITQTEQWRFLSDRNCAELEMMTKTRGGCDKICISKILTKCLKAKQLKAEHIEADSVKAHDICAQGIKSDVLCARAINATESICAPVLASPEMCTEQLNATNICSSGLIQANSFQQCGLYRATAVFSANTPYVLGTNLDFDLVLDDPDNDITLAPTVYNAPLSGYYMVMVQVDQNDLAGADSVLGIPIGNIEILVNGVTFRENFVPFLSFHNEQKSTVSALMSLKAGDTLSVRYNVFVMTDSSGFSPYSGTVQILGSGTEGQGTIIKIHYLSSDCVDLPPCVPCVSVCTPEPCDIVCAAVECHDMSCCDQI